MGVPMKTKQPIIESHIESPKSPVDLWKLMGGKAKRVAPGSKPQSDSMLAVYKNRLTYTFIMGREVASIHFDKTKKEIFFKGHNIRNLSLDESQRMVLSDFKAVLAADERAKLFLKDYEATLGSLLAENK